MKNMFHFQSNIILMKVPQNLNPKSETLKLFYLWPDGTCGSYYQENILQEFADLFSNTTWFKLQQFFPSQDYIVFEPCFINNDNSYAIFSKMHL